MALIRPQSGLLGTDQKGAGEHGRLTDFKMSPTKEKAQDQSTRCTRLAMGELQGGRLLNVHVQMVERTWAGEPLILIEHDESQQLR